MEIQFSAAQTSAGTAGVGDYKFTIPGGYTFDSSVIDTTSNALPHLGGARLNVAGTDYDGVISLLGGDTNEITIRVDDDTASLNTWGSGFGPASVNLTLGFQASIPIAEWANAGVTVPIVDLTEQTKIVDNSVLQISSTNRTVSVVRLASGMAYKDSDGTYRFRFNINVQMTTSDADAVIEVAGIEAITDPDGYQVVSGDSGGLGGTCIYTDSRIFCVKEPGAANNPSWRIGGDISLVAKAILVRC